MIEVQNLTKRYGQHVALDGVSFSVAGVRLLASLAQTAPAKAPPCAS